MEKQANKQTKKPTTGKYDGSISAYPCLLQHYSQ
jgi:hypothetical protein